MLAPGPQLRRLAPTPRTLRDDRHTDLRRRRPLRPPQLQRPAPARHERTDEDSWPLRLAAVEAGSFSGQFSRPLPGPPWSGENGVGLARVHAVSSLMRSARGFSLAWSRRVRDRGLLPRARDADSFV